MELKKILEKNGYVVNERMQGETTILQCSNGAVGENRISSFGIKFEEGTSFYFWDATKQVPELVEFEDQKSLIEFLSENFPLRT